jgi:hypothetical protein
MKKSLHASEPGAYIASLNGWQRTCVEYLRSIVRGASSMEEAVKWGHLVFSSDGPVLFIRAESKRVLFGFWRGRRLRSIEPGLRASGKYEMATLELHKDETIAPAVARRLVKQAVALNKKLGDPRLAARRR